MINESLPNLNLKRNCIQLWGKHLLSNPFFPLQVSDEIVRNKHPETAYYTVKEDDCNIEIIDRQCQHVALTLDLPYHRPKDIELLAIAQAVGMVPAADNSFKYQSNLKGGKASLAMKVGLYYPKHKGKGGKTTFIKKVGIHDPNYKGKGARAHNVLMGNQQWNDNRTKVLLKYVIANCGSGKHGGINWSNWNSDGVEGCKKGAGQSKLQSLVRKQYKKMNGGDDKKTNNDANTKQLHQSLLAEQLS